MGESPGADEVENQEVFTGRTGRWLTDRLSESGIKRDDLTLINAIGCQPPKGMKTDTNMGHAAVACYPMFASQYAPYAGRPVLMMGKWAAWAANEQRNITIETGRGFIRPLPNGSQGEVTWHPTYAAYHNPWKRGEFTNDVDRFARLMQGKLEPAPTTLIRPTVSALNALLREANGVLAVDIETRAPHGQPPHLGKDPTRADLRTIAFGHATRGIAYWWGSDIKVQAWVLKVLANPKVLKVFHNGWFFDLRVLERFGAKVVNVMDTRDMRRAVSATSRLSLRFLASVYSDFAPWKEDEK